MGLFREIMGIFILIFGTLIGSLVATRLEPQFYGIGALFGALLGWTFSYFRIRYLETHFDYHIMCSMHVIKAKHTKKPDSVVYRRDGEK